MQIVSDFELVKRELEQDNLYDTKDQRWKITDNENLYLHFRKSSIIGFLLL